MSVHIDIASQQYEVYRRRVLLAGSRVLLANNLKKYTHTFFKLFANHFHSEARGDELKYLTEWLANNWKK